MEELLKKLDAIQTGIDQRLEKANEQARTAADSAAKKVQEDLMTEVKNLTQLHKETVEKLEKAQQELAKRQDDTETRLNRPGGSKNGGTEKNLGQLLGEKIKGMGKDPKQPYEQTYDQLIKNKNPFSIEFNEVKAADIMLTGTNVSGTNFILPTRVPGIVYDPVRREHVRDFTPVGSTNSNAIQFVQETGYEAGPAITAEGADKPLMDFNLGLATANVRKIAALMRVSDEMLSDIPYITSYLTTRGVEKYKLVEDTQLLYGDGTGNNILGIIPQADDYVDILAETTITRLDVILAAITQIRVNEYSATRIIMHPNDLLKLRIKKSTTGEYVFPFGVYVDAPTGMMSIAGVPVVESTMITEGQFLVGDFVRGAQIFDREGVNVAFFDQDRDNVQKNLVTIRIEGRLTLVVYRPEAFVHGTWTAALATGSA